MALEIVRDHDFETQCGSIKICDQILETTKTFVLMFWDKEGVYC